MYRLKKMMTMRSRGIGWILASLLAAVPCMPVFATDAGLKRGSGLEGGVESVRERLDQYRRERGSILERLDRREMLASYVDIGRYPHTQNIKPHDLHHDEIQLTKIILQTEPTLHKSAPHPSSGSIDTLIEYYASLHKLSPALVWAVVKAESDFDPDAVSRSGAKGLMQLMPSTAIEMGVTNAFDPVQNIAGGTQYLSKMLELFNGNLNLALAAYNAGPGNVGKYGGVPPFPETLEYIRRVKQLMRQYTNEFAIEP